MKKSILFMVGDTSKLILLIFSLSLALIGAEGISRWLGLAPELGYVEKWRVRLSPNPDLIYEQIPNLSAEGQSAQYFMYPDKTTSMGFRDIERPKEKPPGIRRMIVLGDSVVAGIWVDDGESIMTRLLENSLSARTTPWQVWNFAVPGYNTRQEVAMLEDRGLELEADWVVLVYCPNDRRVDNGGIVGHLKASDPGNVVQWNGWLDRYSHFYRALKYHIVSHNPPVPASSEQVSDENVRTAFHRLAALSSRHGFRALVVTFPNFDDLREGGCLSGENKQLEEVVSWALQAGLHATNACPYFEKALTGSPPAWLFYDRYHLTGEGQMLASRVLEEILEPLVDQP